MKLVGLRKKMSSKQTLLCFEGLALSVQCGFGVVGCPEHRVFVEVPGLLCLQPSQLHCSVQGGRGAAAGTHSLAAALGSPRLPGAPCQADTRVPLLTWVFFFFCFCDKTVIAGQIEIKTRSLECAQPDWYLFWGRGARGGGGSDVNWPSGPVATAGFGCLPAAQLCLHG